MKLLFICLEHWNRSRAAEDLVNKAKRHQAKSCGLEPLSDMPVSSKLLRWADRIFVMEPYMKDYLHEKFPMEKIDEKIKILDIPDTFLRGESELARILKRKLKDYL